MIDLQEMVRLYRLGTEYRRVATLLGMSPNTKQAYQQVLENAGLLTGSTSDLPDVETLQTLVHGVHPPRAALQQVSSADGWTAVIEPLWTKGLGPKVIHDRLRVSNPTFSASLSAVKRPCLRLKRARGITAAEVVIPVDTAPGDVAQVNFGYVGLLWDPDSRTYRKAWVFVLVLGYIRHMWADIVFDQSVETWIRLHERAFAVLGAGAPYANKFMTSQQVAPPPATSYRQPATGNQLPAHARRTVLQSPWYHPHGPWVACGTLSFQFIQQVPHFQALPSLGQLSNMPPRSCPTRRV